MSEKWVLLVGADESVRCHGTFEHWVGADEERKALEAAGCTEQISIDCAEVWARITARELPVVERET